MIKFNFEIRAKLGWILRQNIKFEFSYFSMFELEKNEIIIKYEYDDRDFNFSLNLPKKTTQITYEGLNYYS